MTDPEGIEALAQTYTTRYGKDGYEVLKNGESWLRVEQPPDQRILRELNNLRDFLKEAHIDALTEELTTLRQERDELTKDIAYIHEMHDEEAARVYPEIYRLGGQVSTLQTALSEARAALEEISQ